MKKGLVSVIIPNYNYAKFIQRTIKSVLAQTYSNIEIIVIDDGSTDGSLRVLEEFGDKVMTIVQNNQGVSRARNRGFEASSGEFIAFLDADDLWLPQKIERQISCFQEDEMLGFVHCSMTLIGPNEEPIADITNGSSGFIADAFLRFEGEGAVVGAGSTGIVRRVVFSEVGGFDPEMSTAADWDFCYRIARRHKVGFVTDPLVLYRVHNSNMHNNIRAMEHDMIIGFKKAFTEESGIDKIRCYGNLYRVLAGSYFRAGMYSDFLRNAAKSLWYRPSGIGYFAAFPLRRFRKTG
ncbi:MAG: glycosyltransferase family 2 protein [Blastocatellia bacterium]|nr:glycosyltransferase family 2 protein [Chloracidobacterium sp.]MBL8186193.1 glycosyltransferase family 2 protein [Blastocatellia bacterium]